MRMGGSFPAGLESADMVGLVRVTLTQGPLLSPASPPMLSSYLWVQGISPLWTFIQLSLPFLFQTF
jgi:hypothetical protein